MIFDLCLWILDSIFLFLFVPFSCIPSRDFPVMPSLQCTCQQAHRRQPAGDLLAPATKGLLKENRTEVTSQRVYCRLACTS
ncbi:hypothetical protein L6452_39258 [Arctium lappa]|uniref:Uncharacterized protein n=1 Tax=Arctium lappa TaxID=4217 RepID=A0ACB8XVX2_ARCLA|nr:hypothetical protein L6452_39258 [Arctium lappa]